jgi:UDP-glucose 6-dehydrogenase
VPIGTAQETERAIRALYRTQDDFEKHISVVFMPEFMSQGQAVDKLVNPELIIIGTSKSKRRNNVFNQVKSLFSHCIEKTNCKVIHNH